MAKSRFTALLAGVLFAALTWAQAAGKAEAEKLFKQYVALEHAYDPAVADLYADDANIRNKRVYPSGQVRELTLPAPVYKNLVRQAMPTAKAKGDRSTYSEVSYSSEGKRVRIAATRFSELKKYGSPLSLVVGPGPGGKWLIYEELSESRP